MVPKRVHYCWLSGEPQPEMIRRYIDGWKKILPDYEFWLWDRERFDIASVPWVQEAFDLKKYAFAADYIRFYALYHYGGIYLDSDVEVLKSFDPFLVHRSFIGFEYCSIPEAAVIGAEKGVPWIGDCLDWYRGESFHTCEGKIKTSPVPLLIKKVLEIRTGVPIIDTGKKVDFPEVTLYPFCYFSPKNCYKGTIETTSETVTVHNFTAMWLKKGIIYKFGVLIHLGIYRILGKKRHDLLFYRFWCWPYSLQK